MKIYTHTVYIHMCVRACVHAWVCGGGGVHT